MKKNILVLSLISMLSLTISGCGDNTISDLSNTPSNDDLSNTPSDESSSGNIYESMSDESYKGSIEEDYTKLIPDDVLNASVSIDFLTYIEGQDGYITDIGN